MNFLEAWFTIRIIDRCDLLIALARRNLVLICDYSIVKLPVSQSNWVVNISCSKRIAPFCHCCILCIRLSVPHGSALSRMRRATFTRIRILIQRTSNGDAEVLAPVLCSRETCVFPRDQSTSGWISWPTMTVFLSDYLVRWEASRFPNVLLLPFFVFTSTPAAVRSRITPWDQTSACTSTNPSLILVQTTSLLSWLVDG